jgi:phospholipase/lecithinase/hemolysin
MARLSQRIVLAGVMLAGMSGLVAEPARGFTTIYAFGDSLSDAGNAFIATGGAIPASPPYSAGRFSNGAIWVQDLSRSLGLGVVRPALSGGTDFAVGGAETGTTPVHQANAIDLPTQVAAFVALVPSPPSDALYALWIGSNDLLDILAASGLSQAQGQAAADKAVANVKSAVGARRGHSAAHLLTLTVPDLGVTPQVRELGPAARANATALSLYFDEHLKTVLQSIAARSGLDLKIVDTFALIDAVVASPATYGFRNVSTPCWTGTFSGMGGTLCAMTRVAQNRHLFWDHLHPTARGHALIASDAAAVLQPVAAAWHEAAGE